LELSDYIDNLLNKAGDIFLEEKEKLISREDLLKITYGQFHFIDAISEDDSPTISSLADKMNLSKPTVTVAIQKMEKSSLVFKKQSDSDKRVSYIFLTDKGKLIKQAEQNSLKRMEKILMSKLNEEELKYLKNILAKTIG